MIMLIWYMFFTWVRRDLLDENEKNIFSRLTFRMFRKRFYDDTCQYGKYL